MENREGFGGGGGCLGGGGDEFIRTRERRSVNWGQFVMEYSSIA